MSNAPKVKFSLLFKFVVVLFPVVLVVTIVDAPPVVVAMAGVVGEWLILLQLVHF